jgi:hypothetical protein
MPHSPFVSEQLSPENGEMPKYSKVELILFISVHQSTTNKMHKYFNIQSVLDNIIPPTCLVDKDNP